MILGWKKYFLLMYEDIFTYLNINQFQGNKSFQSLHNKIRKSFKIRIDCSLQKIQYEKVSLTFQNKNVDNVDQLHNTLTGYDFGQGWCVTGR